jgi:hypothetical protein
MTTQHLTPVSAQVQSPCVELVVAELAAEKQLVAQARQNIADIQQAVAGWQATIAELLPVAEAQRAGDEMYAWTLEHTGDGEQAAVNYHLEYQTVARELGCGPVCGCQLCAEQFGGAGAK